MSFRVRFNTKVNGFSPVSPFSNKVYQYSGRRFKEGEVVVFDDEDRGAVEKLIASDTLGIARGEPCATILDEADPTPVPTPRQRNTMSMVEAQDAFDPDKSQSFEGKQEQVQEREEAEKQKFQSRRKKTAKELRAEVLGG